MLGNCTLVERENLCFFLIIAYNNNFFKWLILVKNLYFLNKTWTI